MKMILKHGKGKIIYNFTCSRCGCEFTADEEDVKIKESYLPWGEDEFETTCPECYKELSGEKIKTEYLDAFIVCIYVNSYKTGTYTHTSPDRTDDYSNL